MSKKYAKISCSGPPGCCFAQTSWALSKSQDLNVILVQDATGKKYYFSVQSTGLSRLIAAGESSDVLAINGVLARGLQLQHGQEVVVSEVLSKLPTLKSIHVKCETEDDWEILESNAEIVTSAALNQIRVAYRGQKLPLWVSRNLNFTVTVEKLEPDVEVGILDNASEVIIPSVPPTRSLRAPLALGSNFSARLQRVYVKHDFHLSSASMHLLSNVDAAYIYKEGVGDLMDASAENGDAADFFHARLQATVTTDDISKTESVLLKVFFIEQLILENPEISLVFPKFNPTTVFVHPKAVEWPQSVQVNVEPVLAEFFGDRVPRFSAIPAVLETVVGSPYQRRTFKKSFELGKCFLKSSLGLGAKGHQVYGPRCGWLLLTGKEGSGKSCFAAELVQKFATFPYFVHCRIVSCISLRGKKPETVQKAILTAIHESVQHSPSVCILDDLDQLCSPDISDQQNLQEDFLHLRLSETIHDTVMTANDAQVAIICTAKSPGALHAFWKNRPGVHLFQQEVHLPSPDQDERLSIFEECLRRYHGETGAIRETARRSIPPCKAVSQGDFSFQDNSRLTFSSAYWHEHDDQITRMTDCMRHKLQQLHDDFATPRTLHRLARKWAHQRQTPKDNNVAIVEQQFESFLEAETKGLNSTSADKQITWDDIGGLEQIKKQLTQILIWPIEYAALFEKSPVKMPSGVLLYGYPGTGKTIVGLATASMVPNAKFIHIKGPELLSKFIGASEQAVQDLFRKARDQSPCIIFFDEFDSLVPRRGHDSTGVTDRVVNSFLTEMDGIEGGLGKGVYLVASTSRPDLIDPAVLRPGRLDKHFFFDMPKAEERADILRALARKAETSGSAGEIRWNEMGRETDKFTAADLHSLLSTAQLEAIQDSLASVLSTSLDRIHLEELENVQLPSKIPLTLDHLKKALDTTKPSMTVQEFAKYRNIYDSFARRKIDKSEKLEEQEEGQFGSAFVSPGKKATLA